MSKSSAAPSLSSFSNAGLLSALSYSLFSMTITLTNKALLTSYGFESTLTLTFLQGLVTVVALDVMRLRGWISFPSFNFSTARDVLPLALVFVAYVVISLISLGRVNVRRRRGPTCARRTS